METVSYCNNKEYEARRMTNEGDKFPALGLPVGGNTERQQILELQAQLQAWEELWRAIKDMEPELGDANKPLAIAASYALLQIKVRDLESELELRKQNDGAFYNQGFTDARAAGRSSRDVERAKIERLLDLLYRATANNTHRQVAEALAVDWCPLVKIEENGKIRIEINSHQQVGTPRDGVTGRRDGQANSTSALSGSSSPTIGTGGSTPNPSPPNAKYKLQYNKLTRKIDRVSLVTGLVADSFDPPEECHC